MEIARYDATWWVVSGKLEPRVVEYIRRSIPPKYRFFDEALEKWRVHNLYAESTKQLIDSCNKALVEDDPYAVLHLRPTAPPAIIRAAWRELAKSLHPDRGGDVEQFKRAKAAYDQLMAKV